MIINIFIMTMKNENKPTVVYFYCSCCESMASTAGGSIVTVCTAQGSLMQGLVCDHGQDSGMSFT